jgi:SAM-dependent methyltransferase
VPKVRDSGMPAIEQWEAYFDAVGILESLGCRGVSGDAIEFGCGYGTFTIFAAQRISGMLYALDIDAPMVDRTAARASQAGLQNVTVEQRDFVTRGCGRESDSASFVMLFNILHIEDPVNLLAEAFRVLRPGGIAAIIHWNHDVRTPRGPPLDIRPQPAQCRAWGEEAGLRWVRDQALPGSPWHWGLVLEKHLAV